MVDGRKEDAPSTYSLLTLIAEMAFIADTAFKALVARSAVVALAGFGEPLTDFVVAGLEADFVLVSDFLVMAI